MPPIVAARQHLNSTRYLHSYHFNAPVDGLVDWVWSWIHAPANATARQIWQLLLHTVFPDECPPFTCKDPLGLTPEVSVEYWINYKFIIESSAGIYSKVPVRVVGLHWPQWDCHLNWWLNPLEVSCKQSRTKVVYKKREFISVLPSTLRLVLRSVLVY